jgi:hypothetical protein
LGDPDQDHLPLAALSTSRLDQRPSLGLVALPLLEMHHRDSGRLGEAMDVLHIAQIPSSAAFGKIGDGNRRCQRKNRHTCPTDCSLGTYPCRKNRSTDLHVKVV